MRNIIITLVVVLGVEAAPSTRETVMRGLNSTAVVAVGNLHGFTMSEMLAILHQHSGGKINFLYLPHMKPKAQPSAVNTNRLPAGVQNPIGIGINPATGLPLGQPLPNFPLQQMPQLVQADEEPKVRAITGVLKNLTLKQLLDLTSMSMHPPVQYVVTDFGVIFIPREDTGEPPLFNRVLRINPHRVFRINPRSGHYPLPQSPIRGVNYGERR